MNSLERNGILDKEAIRRKLRRMAFEIIENNSEETALIIAGITGNGEILAKRLLTELAGIASLTLDYVTIQLDKKSPLAVSVNPALDANDKVVIVVDDVANSGRTMLYALKPFLEQYPKKIQTLVLVERSHKLYPLHTDYVGTSLSTTLQEHIVVDATGGELTGAWLQ